MNTPHEISPRVTGANRLAHRLTATQRESRYWEAYWDSWYVWASDPARDRVPWREPSYPD